MNQKTAYDSWFLLSVITLLGVGLIMVASTSISLAGGEGMSAFRFVTRQSISLAVGLTLSFIITYIPLRVWQKISLPFLGGSIFFLTFLLIPGVSREVNGSVRWLFIGPISIQVSEFAKLALIIYIAGFLVRRSEEIKTKISGFLKPVLLLGLVAGLILLEPDFGTAVVIISTVMGMLFLGGVPLKRFFGLFGLALCGLVVLSVSSPYRMARLTAFLNPWADQFNTGYQLTQSLIAFGRGGWMGAGLGNSVQKLLYLPESHTDFLYAVLAEELGLLGALLILIFFSILVWRMFCIGRRAMLAKEPFAGYIAYGIALWIGLQSMINIGVNVGVLPTKGLTLPLMSYGGCSLIVGLLALGLVFRIDFEARRKVI
jgi:cell division protein FtsW